MRYWKISKKRREGDILHVFLLERQDENELVDDRVER